MIFLSPALIPSLLIVTGPTVRLLAVTLLTVISSFKFTVILAALSPSSTTTLVFLPSTKFTLPWVLIRDVSLPLFLMLKPAL